jgi:thymidine phosphorylase
MNADLKLRARRLGLDTHAETVVLLHKDCPVSRSEGFTSHNRILLSAGSRHAIATLYQVESDLIGRDEIGLSDATWHALSVKDGDAVTACYAPPVESLSLLRSRIFGHELGPAACQRIVSDIVAGRYSAIEVTSFITACAAKPLNREEVCSVTQAMVDAGERLRWPFAVIADKHSVGGIPGNRTTPIIVAIAAAQGLIMPKTSSRAITSPAGTADTVETLMPVALEAARLRQVVEKEGGCMAWGGALQLSPADDILIRIEHALDIDSEGQMIASILSKKIAAGATHLVVDMPVGPSAKVRSQADADSLEASLKAVAERFGIEVDVVRGDGRQPIGRGIGPALEARDVLAVLQNASNAPADLKDRALLLAGRLLELAGKAARGQGVIMAAQTLADGTAWQKFQSIAAAQGGMREPVLSSYRRTITAGRNGKLVGIDNRKIARLAKLAGAPYDKAAGVELLVRLDQDIAPSTPLLTVHAETPGELAYALTYHAANQDMLSIS